MVDLGMDMTSATTLCELAGRFGRLLERQTREAVDLAGVEPMRFERSGDVRLALVYFSAVLWSPTRAVALRWLAGALDDERLGDGTYSVIRHEAWPRLVERLELDAQRGSD
jgi:hypothetical protein